jgi:hypothetical protein
MVGLYLVYPHARMVAEGLKKAIVKSRLFSKYVGEEILVVSRHKGHGYIFAKIKLHEPRAVPLEEFQDLWNLHRITEKERRRDWSGYRTLYLYEFDLIKAYDPPIPTYIPHGVQVWVNNLQKTAAVLRQTAEELVDRSVYASIVSSVAQKSRIKSRSRLSINGV